jgi:hypothetical protein
MIDVDRPRSPSELRDVLEVRVRRQAQTYSAEQRRQALVELRDLADAAVRRLDTQRDGR